MLRVMHHVFVSSHYIFCLRPTLRQTGAGKKIISCDSASFDAFPCASSEVSPTRFGLTGPDCRYRRRFGDCPILNSQGLLSWFGIFLMCHEFQRIVESSIIDQLPSLP